METLAVSLPRLHQLVDDDSAKAQHGLRSGRFRCNRGVTVGDQQWPYDYLVVLLDGSLRARNRSGAEALSRPGDAALWRANEYWAVDAIDESKAVTLQADHFDVDVIRLLSEDS